MNQTASQLSTEYFEAHRAVAAQYIEMRRNYPFESFPDMVRSMSYLRALQRVWSDIAKSIKNGPDMYESEDENYSEWGLM